MWKWRTITESRAKRYKELITGEGGNTQMAESQNIEYKESWRDEYLKFDDAGNVVGVQNVKKLLEDIPNKIQSGLGIVADVNKHTKDGKDYLEIKVDPSSFPISYHGEFHYRSGATKQQLTGIALTEFITKKAGVRWEDVTVDGITVDDLDAESFKIFRREALRSKRMTEAELNISNEELLSKLKLLSNGKLKRSAVLLFYGDPSIVQNGSYVKVGKFGDHGVEYHDDFEGSLISTADKIVDLIYLKYLKAKITYEHDRRVETYPFARNAIREAIYNAIAHNCYMYGTPIQIRIEEEQIIISNRCILPEGWTAETLMQPHDSIPYNPDIANVFYRAGYIETWGQGIQKICDECIALGAELPRYEIIGTGLRVYFPALKSALIDQPKAPKHQNTDKHGALDDAMVLRIIEILKEEPDISQEALADRLGSTRRIIQKHISVLKEAGRIERVGGKRYGHWEVR